jgi:hypothetical protein
MMVGVALGGDCYADGGRSYDGGVAAVCVSGPCSGRLNDGSSDGEPSGCSSVGDSTDAEAERQLMRKRRRER